MGSRGITREASFGETARRLKRVESACETRSGGTVRETRSGKTARVAISGEIAPEVVIDGKGMIDITALEVTTGGKDSPRTQIVER